MRRLLALSGTVVLVFATLAAPAFAATPQPFTPAAPTQFAGGPKPQPSPAPKSGPKYKFNPKHPCAGLTMKTKITAQMLPKVGKCSSIQASPGKSPTHSTAYGCSKCTVATNGGMTVTVTQEPDGLYSECLHAAYGEILLFSRYHDAGMCRQVSPRHNYPWVLSGVLGQKMANFNAHNAKVLDEKVSNHIRKQQHEGGGAPNPSGTKILGACTAGAIGGVIASAATGPGMILGAAGGCVGGTLTVVFSAF